MPMLQSKLKKLWAIKYFWVLLHVLITIFYDLCSVTFMSSVHVSSCVVCPYRNDTKGWIKNVQFFIIMSSCENWVTRFSKILISECLSSIRHFEVQHVCLSKLRKLWAIKNFYPFACSHYSLLQFVFSYIHVTFSCLFMCDMSI